MIRSRLRDESGVTLVEVTIVVALLGLVMAFVLRSVVSYQTAAMGGIQRLENLEEGRLLMQVMSKDIRTAAKLDATTSPFVIDTGTVTRANDNELWFYANLNLTTQCPKKIRIYVDASKRITEAIYEPTGGAPPSCTSYPPDNAPTRTRIVGRYVANTTSQPIFTYYREIAGVLTPFCPSASASGCSVIGDQTPLSVSNALLVDAVGIQLSIRKDTTYSVDHTTLTNTVRLANVYYYPAPSTSP